MAMSADNAVRGGLVRRGVSLEIFTLWWMTVEAAVALGAGVAAGSVALLAFGLDSVIEFVAALVVLRTFRAEQAGRSGSERERWAVRVIGVTFFVLAAYIVVEAAYTLITASKPTAARRAWRFSGRFVGHADAVRLEAADRRCPGSQMLLADAAASLFCAYLSATVLVGLVLNAALGWWWADPVAALAVVPLVVKEGLEAFEGDERD